MPLGARVGSLALTCDGDTVNRVVTNPAVDAVPTETVFMTTLDDALASRVPILLKIDVEGYESEVLDGAAQTLAAPALRGVLLEPMVAVVVKAMPMSICAGDWRQWGLKSVPIGLSIAGWCLVARAGRMPPTPSSCATLLSWRRACGMPRQSRYGIGESNGARG